MMNISREAQIKMLANLQDEDIDYSDIPETDAQFWADAKIEYPPKKVQVTLSIDEAVLNFFKQETKGEEYQALINGVLADYAFKIQEKRTLQGKIS